MVRLLVVFLLIAGATSGVTAAANPAPTPQALSDTVVFQQETTPTQQNNSTVQQEDPETVAEDGDSEALRSYLAQSLARRLQGSTVNLSQGEYDQARELVGEEYQEDFEKFVEVSGETDGDQTPESFEQAIQNQQEFINRTQSYRETKAEYEEAVANGNETRARELARELNQIAAQVNESEGNVSRSYTAVQNQTGANLSREETSVQEVGQNITSDAASVVQATFIQTRLSAEIDRTSISFLNPVALTGTLQTGNGTAVANQSVTLSVGGQQLTTQTDSTGSFSVEYRPVLIDVNATTLNVSYQPSNGSVYLGNSTTVPVTGVEQVVVEQTVTGPDSAGFGETVTISGQIDAEGVPVGDVPVRIMAGDVRLGTVRTNESGVYSLTTTLPANVSSGSQSITASIPLTGRAVAGQPVQTTVQISETATELDLDTAVNSTTGTVSGALTTTSGAPLPNQQLDVLVDGTVVTTVETNSEGQFATTVARPLANTTRATVTIRYDSAGTNLGDSQARSVLEWEGETDGQSGLLQTLVANQSVVVVGGIGVLVLASGAGLLFLIRDEDQVAAVGDSTNGPTENGPAVSDSVDDSSVTDRVDALTQHLDDDPTAAVTLAFTLVRTQLAESTNVDNALTHREFLRKCQRSVSAEQFTQLEALTDMYERAAFRSTPISDEEAQDVVDIAKSLLR
ncbi:hypothetical protein [Halobaculum limi]|uniref:hypothetical protein n=1 Tax=Halobaculum limi TaxID=3031916 RepID=UPI002405058E|nr:hypothetical protein [Halobaculum sp. YSMS11]